MTQSELQRIATLVDRARKQLNNKFDISNFCFDRQLNFIRDVHRFKTAVCSRRAGKTVACAAHLIHSALERANTTSLYITLSRSNAKKIVWPELCAINREFKLEARINESDLSISFPNGSKIYASGASDKTEVDKFRGLALYLCYIDEAQAFGGYIKSLIDQVISPALFDYRGTLCLIGTPGPHPSGFFYECASSSKWSHHSWTMWDNPWLLKKSGKPAQQLLNEELERKGVQATNATIQREMFGKWATDTNVLVFQYNADKNDFAKLPEVSSSWRYIIGVDIGYDDADAIAVLGWNDKLRGVYLIEEKVETGQGITELASNLLVFLERYSPDKIVLDTGGLGKKIAEEIRRRFQVPIIAAEKQRKLEFIEILNDAMRTEKFYARKTSRFAEDCFKVQWELDVATVEDRGEKPAIKFRNEKRIISDSYHSDVTDAVLYAFREALHWLYEPEPVKIEKGTPEWYKNIEKEMESGAIKQLERQKETDSWKNGEPFGDDPWSQAPWE